jgi:hypothetical protein
MDYYRSRQHSSRNSTIGCDILETLVGTVLSLWERREDTFVHVGVPFGTVDIQLVKSPDGGSYASGTHKSSLEMPYLEMILSQLSPSVMLCHLLPK